MKSAFNDRYSQMEPRVYRRDCGGWLAVSEIEAPITLGVIADSADEARDRFATAVRAWGLVLDETS